jgi:hypothetical protein
MYVTVVLTVPKGTKVQMLEFLIKEDTSILNEK